MSTKTELTITEKDILLVSAAASVIMSIVGSERLAEAIGNISDTLLEAQNEAIDTIFIHASDGMSTTEIETTVYRLMTEKIQGRSK